MLDHESSLSKSKWYSFASDQGDIAVEADEGAGEDTCKASDSPEIASVSSNLMATAADESLGQLVAVLNGDLQIPYLVQQAEGKETKEAGCQVEHKAPAPHGRVHTAQRRQRT